MKEDIILEHSQLSGWHIQFIYKIVTSWKDFGVHDLVHLHFSSLELVLEVQKLSIFDVYQVLVLYQLDWELLTPRSHFDFALLYQSSTALFKTFVQILWRNYNTSAWSQGLDFQASILYLSQHFLNWRNLVDDVQMVSAVHSDVESAGKLLWWMNESLESDVGHLEGFGESIGLGIEHLESRMYHILFQLALNDFNGAGCIVLCTQSLAFFHRLRSLGQLSSNVVHLLLCLLLDLLLNLLFEPSSCYFADLMSNLIFGTIVVKHFQLIEFINVCWDYFTTQYDHINSLQLPRFNLRLQELLLFFSNLRMYFWACLLLISFTDFHFILDVLLES